MPAASPDERKSGTTAQRETNADESAAAQHTMKGREAAATPAERPAFAACLARHGYYKGYYH